MSLHRGKMNSGSPHCMNHPRLHSRRHRHWKPLSSSQGPKSQAAPQEAQWGCTGCLKITWVSNSRAWNDKFKCKTCKIYVQIHVFTCSQGQPKRMAVFCFKGVSSYVENTLRHIHDGGEGDHGEEDECSSGNHHVPSVPDYWHGEKDVGEHPAAKCCPVEQLLHRDWNFYIAWKLECTVLFDKIKIWVINNHQSVADAYRPEYLYWKMRPHGLLGVNFSAIYRMGLGKPFSRASSYSSIVSCQVNISL